MRKRFAAAVVVVSCLSGLPLKSFVGTSSAKSCVALTEFDRAIADWRSGKISLQVSARLMSADGGQQVEYTSAGPAQIFIGRLTIPSPTDWERPVHTWTVVLSDNILQRWQPPSSPLWEAVPRKNALPETWAFLRRVAVSSCLHGGTSTGKSGLLFAGASFNQPEDLPKVFATMNVVRSQPGLQFPIRLPKISESCVDRSIFPVELRELHPCPKRINTGLITPS